MKEYIEREAVLNLLEKINPVDFGSMFDYKAHGAVGECLREIRYGVEDIPAADVVEVVRCKDCQYWQDNNGGYPHPECRWGDDETPDADDYCSFGERMDKEDDNE